MLNSSKIDIWVDLDIDVILRNITKENYVLNWLPANILVDWLSKWSIKIIKLNEWDNLIEEWSKDCWYFYILLEWLSWVFIKWKKIASITPFSTIWEMWFMNSNLWRLATIKCEEDSTLIKIWKEFINWLTEEQNTMVYKNLFIEASNRMNFLNQQLWERNQEDNIDSIIWSLINSSTLGMGQSALRWL